MGHIGGTRKPQTHRQTDTEFLRCTEILSDLIIGGPSVPKRAATTAAVLGLGIICAIISSGINTYIYIYIGYFYFPLYFSLKVTEKAKY